MITTTLTFDSYDEAITAFDKARAAYEIGYGFYPKLATSRPCVHPFINSNDTGKYTFTYSRGESCD